MSRVHLFQSPSRKTKHIAFPSTVDANKNADTMVPYCGRFFDSKTYKETYNSIEEAMRSTDICENCLTSVGVIKHPSIKDAN